MNNRLVLGVQIVLTFTLVGFCGYKLSNEKISGDAQALYASIATGMIARWFPTPGEHNFAQKVDQMNVESRVTNQD